ncbi:487_t:CDS:2, partial [Acaulospora colombiana]
SILTMENKPEHESAPGAVDVAYQVAEGVANVAVDTAKLFFPWIEGLAKLLEEANNAYENAKYNKTTCVLLFDRIENGVVALKKLYRHREDNEKEFRKKSFYTTFIRFINIMNKVKDFMKDISELNSCAQYFASKSIKKRLEELIKEYDTASGELHLAITVYSAEQTEKELASMHRDIEQTKKLVGTLKSSIEIKVEDVSSKVEDLRSDLDKKWETLRDTNELVREMNRQLNNADSQTSFTPPQIPENKLTYPAIGKPTDKRGSVYKRMLNLAQEVACKPITREQLSKKLQSELAILKKMDICKNIIRFHGISKLNGEHVIIFDWAEYGTLKDVYEKKIGIDWNKKLLIARDVCSGLVYLHECSILHHDIRCESILVVDTAGSLDVKIANFNLSREHNEHSREIKSPAKLLPWLAPEKMRDSKTRYDVKCETYSFGMLLWELGHEKIPYSRWKDDAVRLKEYVLSGKREEINFGLCSDLIKKMIEAWKDDPMVRPLVQVMLIDLQSLCERYSPTLPPQRITTRQDSEFDLGEDFEDFGDDSISVEPPLVSNRTDEKSSLNKSPVRI